MQLFLQMALEKKGSGPLVEKIRRLIDETPLSRSKVVNRLESYLTAKYFPFGPDQLNQYFADKHAGIEPSATTDDLIGLGAHAIRDEKYKNK
jgi:hypothetical protein